MKRPRVGDVVHYIPREGGDPFAAIVIFVSPIEETTRDLEDMPLVNLAVFDPMGPRYLRLAVAFSDVYKNGCWSWRPD